MRIKNDYPAFKLLFRVLENQISLNKNLAIAKKTRFESELTTPIMKLKSYTRVDYYFLR